MKNSSRIIIAALILLSAGASAADRNCNAEFRRDKVICDMRQDFACLRRVFDESQRCFAEQEEQNDRENARAEQEKARREAENRARAAPAASATPSQNGSQRFNNRLYVIYNSETYTNLLSVTDDRTLNEILAKASQGLRENRSPDILNRKECTSQSPRGPYFAVVIYISISGEYGPGTRVERAVGASCGAATAEDAVKQAQTACVRDSSSPCDMRMGARETQREIIIGDQRYTGMNRNWLYYSLRQSEPSLGGSSGELSTSHSLPGVMAEGYYCRWGNLDRLNVGGGSGRLMMGSNGTFWVTEKKSKPEGVYDFQCGSKPRL